MYKYRPNDAEHIRIYGRCIRKTPLALFWTGSGIEFDTDSTEVWLTAECDYRIKEMYLRIELDGCLIQRFMVPQGTHEYCLFRGFPAGELRTVSVIVEAQPMPDDPERRLLIHEINCDCLLQPVAPKSYRIEFVGDSLTSGEGLTGSSAIMDWCTGIFGLTGHYGRTVARLLDAEYSIISQSGWGVYCGWDNNIHCNIPDYYEQICGVLTDSGNAAFGSTQDWDFESWQPDVVVVNLGTNDGGSLTNPEWINPDNGAVFKQSAKEDGTPDDASLKRFEDAMYAFLVKIRKNNPNAYILWAYGMCGPLMEPYIRETIKRFADETGDGKVSYVSLPACPEEDWGSHMHPGAKNHEESARIIVEELERLGVCHR